MYLIIAEILQWKERRAVCERAQAKEERRAIERAATTETLVGGLGLGLRVWGLGL